MQYILYNKLANNGNGKVSADELKAGLSGESELVNVCETDVKEWIKGLTAEDLCIICGGDGTLNRFANDIYGTEVPCDIVLSGAGTGNDFLRDIKEFYDSSDRPSIKKYIEKLPKVKVKDIECRFINGIGFGIDGMCCEEADKMKAAGKQKINYAGLSVKLMLFKYKCPKATITIDDKVVEYNKVWLASAFEGKQYVPEEFCDKLADVLGLDKSKTAFLAEHPYKGNTDPILYRLHEVIDTYGPAIKDIIHEQGGNAIMSAIDFGLDVDVTEDEAGNHRVIIKFDGKLLPYAKMGKYPW